MLDLLLYTCVVFSVLVPGAANIVTGPNVSWWQAAKVWWNCHTYNSLKMITSNKRVAGYHMGFLASSPEIVANTMRASMSTEKEFRPTFGKRWKCAREPFLILLPTNLDPFRKLPTPRNAVSRMSRAKHRHASSNTWAIS